MPRPRGAPEEEGPKEQELQTGLLLNEDDGNSNPNTPTIAPQAASRAGEQTSSTTKLAASFAANKGLVLGLLTGTVLLVLGCGVVAIYGLRFEESSTSLLGSSGSSLTRPSVVDAQTSPGGAGRPPPSASDRRVTFAEPSGVVAGTATGPSLPGSPVGTRRPVTPVIQYGSSAVPVAMPGGQQQASPSTSPLVAPSSQFLPFQQERLSAREVALGLGHPHVIRAHADNVRNAPEVRRKNRRDRETTRTPNVSRSSPNLPSLKDSAPPSSKRSRRKDKRDKRNGGLSFSTSMLPSASVLTASLQDLRTRILGASSTSTETDSRRGQHDEQASFLHSIRKMVPFCETCKRRDRAGITSAEDQARMLERAKLQEGVEEVDASSQGIGTGGQVSRENSASTLGLSQSSSSVEAFAGGVDSGDDSATVRLPSPGTQNPASDTDDPRLMVSGGLIVTPSASSAGTASPLVVDDGTNVGGRVTSGDGNGNAGTSRPGGLINSGAVLVQATNGMHQPSSATAGQQVFLPNSGSSTPQVVASPQQGQQAARSPAPQVIWQTGSPQQRGVLVAGLSPGQLPPAGYLQQPVALLQPGIQQPLMNQMSPQQRQQMFVSGSSPAAAGTLASQRQQALSFFPGGPPSGTAGGAAPRLVSSGSMSGLGLSPGANVVQQGQRQVGFTTKVPWMLPVSPAGSRTPSAASASPGGEVPVQAVGQQQQQQVLGPVQAVGQQQQQQQQVLGGGQLQLQNMMRQQQLQANGALVVQQPVVQQIAQAGGPAAQEQQPIIQQKPGVQPQAQPQPQPAQQPQPQLAQEQFQPPTVPQQPQPTAEQQSTSTAGTTQPQSTTLTPQRTQPTVSPQQQQHQQPLPAVRQQDQAQLPGQVVEETNIVALPQQQQTNAPVQDKSEVSLSVPRVSVAAAGNEATKKTAPATPPSTSTALASTSQPSTATTSSQPAAQPAAQPAQPAAQPAQAVAPVPKPVSKIVPEPTGPPSVVRVWKDDAKDKDGRAVVKAKALVKNFSAKRFFDRFMTVDSKFAFWKAESYIEATMSWGYKSQPRSFTDAQGREAVEVVTWSEDKSKMRAAKIEDTITWTSWVTDPTKGLRGFSVKKIAQTLQAGSWPFTYQHPFEVHQYIDGVEVDLEDGTRGIEVSEQFLVDNVKSTVAINGAFGMGMAANWRYAADRFLAILGEP
ncbi:unnamed protein product [Amoebophrya sp. A25]|nr:unnamed protein product [Amoebophrya sp. A25]|eukprot:GSA25T00021770001.1